MIDLNQHDNEKSGVQKHLPKVTQYSLCLVNSRQRRINSIDILCFCIFDIESSYVDP